MSKQQAYEALVARRKAYDPSAMGLKNPSQIEGGVFDSDHIGPWTLWAHDLNARLMVVGQDWGDEGYFLENRGLDKPGNPTNKALWDLLAGIGVPVPEPPSSGNLADGARSECGVWLTNACLWIKDGGMSAPVRPEWFAGESAQLLRSQIELVQPKVVVALGLRAYDSVRTAFGLEPHRGVFRAAVEGPGTMLQLDGGSVELIAVYHCGARIRNTVRRPTQQVEDWRRVAEALQRAALRPLASS